MSVMKIYKFRPLINGTNFCRLRRIIETGEFWCSNFWELNDPMEGVFSIFNNKEVVEEISKIHGEKARYKICSFSGDSGDDKSGKGFHSPLMWGHYAGGFKGVAIEVSVKDSEESSKISSIKYYYRGPRFINNGTGIKKQVKKILLAKNLVWEYENEYRFLDDLGNDKNYDFKKIGKITAIYFGNPYGNIVNTEEIQKNKIFQKYLFFKKEIIDIIKDLNKNKNKNEKIDCFNVKISRRKVVKKKKINCFDIKTRCEEVVKNGKCKIKNGN